MASTTVWTRLDLAFESSRDYDNPYADVEVWVDLKGPAFDKRVYGFWNGDRTFVVRVLATRPGTWTWTGGSTDIDNKGLVGKSGTFAARDWSEPELAENPNRRGMIGVTADGRGLRYADGTPFFLLGDTWWSVPSFRFPLADDDTPKPPAPGGTLNDYAHYRRKQGFNCIAMLAAHPAWANDSRPARIVAEDGTVVRAAWKQPGTDSAKDMHNEGGRPFPLPGRVPGCEDVFPDVERINPDYFRVLDAKIDYLNSLGFVPFIEVSRRDCGQAWKKYYDWPDSYARYIQYVFRRYQANNTILSPIHYDYHGDTIPAEDYNVSIEQMLKRYGRPPFGTLLSANPNPSTLVNFGEDSWVDLHQSGNVREHDCYWFLTEMHRTERKPALNGEPYYAGLHQLGQAYALRTEPNSEEDETYVRSGLYGSFLSGGLAGFIYGAEGIWQADTEDESLIKMWDAMRWRSADQVRHLRAFAEVKGDLYRTLIPDNELITPNKNGAAFGYYGWAFAARTPASDLFLLYFEAKTAQPAQLRGVRRGQRYRPAFFDPRNGTWSEPGEAIEVPPSSLLPLPDRPDDRDWGLLLERVDTPA